jgi:PAS domain S-box-containing protein
MHGSETAVAAAPDWEVEAARYEAVTRSVGQGVYTIDLGGRLTYLNEAAVGLLGWTLDEIEGRPIHETLAPAPASESRLLGVLRSGIDHAEAGDSFMRGDGSTLLVGYVCSPIFAGDRIVGAVVAFWPR